MPNSKISLWGFVHALGVALYVFIVANVMLNGGKWVGNDSQLGPFAPFAILMLFVLSAAIVGMLVFGKPALWYLDGKKKEAVRLALYTVGWLCVIVLLTFVTMVASR